MDERDRDSILRDLASGDDELRRLAVERLVLLPADEGLPRLVAQLGDESWRVRKAVVERLAALAEPAAVCPALVEALADGENSGRRNAALEAIVRLGGAVMPELLLASEDPDPDVRKQIVDALAGIAEGAAATRLVALLEDSDPNVRGAAADALAAVARADTAPALARAVARDPERLVRLSALRALTELEWAPPMVELEGALSDPLLRPATLALLGFSDEYAALEALLKGLGAGSRAASEAAMEALLRQVARRAGGDADELAGRVREAALDAPEVVERALARLEGGDLQARLNRVQFLGLLGSESVVLPLLRAGRDEVLTDVVLATLEAFGSVAEAVVEARFGELDADERVLACEILGRGNSEAGGRRLLEALLQPDPVVRATAARALGRRRSPDALDALIARFGAATATPDEGEELELLAEAIAAVAAPASADGELARRAVRLVGARLAEGPEAYRAAAAELLGRLGVPAESETFALLMSDPSASVRRAAVEALAAGAVDALPEALGLACADEAASVRIAAANALAVSGQAAALDHLERLASDGEPTVRAAALRALGAPALDADATAARRLLLLERGAAEGGPVAMAALESLRELGDPRAAAIAAALLAADAPELVRMAAACLGRVADARELEVLLPLLAHESWAVRAEVIRVLGERGVQKAIPPLLGRLEAERDEFVREALLCALERLER